MIQIITLKIPENFDYQVHKPLGAYCFLGSLEDFKKYKQSYLNYGSTINFQDHKGINDRSCQYSKYFIQKAAPELNKINKTSYSARFFEILLYPFLINIFNIILYQKSHIQKIIELHKDVDIEIVGIGPNHNYEFQDSYNYHLNGTFNPEFHSWIAMKLVKLYFKDIKILHCLKPQNNFNSNSQIQKQPFKYINGGLTGTGWLSKFLLNLVLSCKQSSRFNKNNYKHDLIEPKEVDKGLFEMVFGLLPKSTKKINYYINDKQKTYIKKFILGSESLYHDDYVKINVADKIEKGARLIGYQHGGVNYGFGSSNLNTASIEYYPSTVFITWGWKEQAEYQGNFIPLPSPYLSKAASSKKNKTNKIIFAGCRMVLLPNKFDSQPNPEKLVKYWNWKLDLLKKLHKTGLDNLIVKPYPQSPCEIPEKKLLSRQFPELQFSHENLESLIKKSALHLTDYPGTPFVFSMAGNIPTVCFWDNENFPFNLSAKRSLQTLKDCKIYHTNPRSAAEHLNTIGSDIMDWWMEKNVQEARKDFAHQYARTSRTWYIDWIKFIARL